MTSSESPVGDSEEGKHEKIENVISRYIVFLISTNSS